MNRPITTQTESFTEEMFDDFYLKGNDVMKLIRADGNMSVYRFKELEEGGSYRAVTPHDDYKNRFYINDEVLVVETAHYLADILRPTLSNVHVGLNLRVYAGEDKHTSAIKVVGEYSTHFDAIIHGDVAGKAFAIVLEATTRVNENDIDAVLKKAELFRSFLSSASPIYCHYGYDITVPKVPFDHYDNVTTVVPCLAGRHFPPELVEACKSKGIIPIYPTGARFTVDNLNLLHGPNHK